MLLNRAYPLLVLTSLGCAARSNLDTAPLQVHVEQDLHEAVLRQLMRDEPPQGRVACIRVRYSDSPVRLHERVDPAPSFLARLRDLAAEVKPGSECRGPAPGPMDEIRHTSSGKPATIYEVSAPRWINEAEAEVSAGWQSTPVTGSYCTYRVYRERSGWRVGECRDRVLSFEAPAKLPPNTALRTGAAALMVLQPL